LEKKRTILVVIGVVLAVVGGLVLYTSAPACPEPKDCSTFAGVCSYTCPQPTFLFLIGLSVPFFGLLLVITGGSLALIGTLRGALVGRRAV